MRKYLRFSLAFVLILSVSCDKSSIPRDYDLTPDDPPANQQSPISTKQVTAGVQGIVMDENNDPVAGAIVTCGNGNATTNSAGTFLIATAKMLEDAAVVTVKKPGYFNGLRTIVVTGKDQVQFVTIKLLPKEPAGTFEASTGGTVTTSNAQFTFGPGMVLDSKNKPFSGSVSLLYAPINPENSDFAKMLPSDLRGINAANRQVGLQSFGMMAVEIQSEAGEVLHLDGQKTVDIKMSIPASLRASAPATIPLWHLDEKDGLWKEEGLAIKSGDNYVGKVKHFSFWNCDAQFPIIEFKAILKDQNGSPIANSPVKIVRSNKSEGYGHTDFQGTVSGMIPANEKVTLILHNDCGKAYFSKEIGPFNSTSDLGIIAAPLPANSYIHLSGNLFTCNNTPVKNGAVAVVLDSIKYGSTVKDGKYQATILRCDQASSNIAITAVDLDNSKQATSRMNITPGDYIADLTACENAQVGTIEYTFNGKTYSFNSVTDTLLLYQDAPGEPFNFSFSDKRSPDGAINWQLSSIAVGAYSVMASMQTLNSYFSGTVTVKISQTGNPGQFVVGSISGSLRDYRDSTSTNPAPPINGSFKVKRNN
ncbi:carboxypeptidase-like regulatory domain-containing protein [Chitinophaga sp. sic0106]|uniref:carboxypeptidase-like regulatory domain-containing protein n=1 Tax=Chitinophaga sp. sic0106 TaxID=2854785 RepID=UPI001C43F507|nr:carboxypeptidase-like regulatory domain-containing protein [Chitinophaga sp. sic0106]MBV7528650.1 hypothetical protein [Chitinophaga sp. sic0106]